jgi:hypothetical protein
MQEFQIPVKLEATLRGYQREGVNWMAFLHEFGLHGVLSDDMGLGKTLQCIAMVVSALLVLFITFYCILTLVFVVCRLRARCTCVAPRASRARRLMTTAAAAALRARFDMTLAL